MRQPQLPVFLALTIAVLVTPAVVSLSAQRRGPEPKTILLWPQGAPGAKGDADPDRPALDLYIPSCERANGAAVVVFPGGKYRYLAWRRHNVTASVAATRPSLVHYSCLLPGVGPTTVLLLLCPRPGGGRITVCCHAICPRRLCVPRFVVRTAEGNSGNS